MRLLEQFRVMDSDGQQHTVAWYQDCYDRSTDTGQRERVDGARRYCLNGGQDVQPIDDETFLTDSGVVLHRIRRRTAPEA
jgi:hypothetical protein